MKTCYDLESIFYILSRISILGKGPSLSQYKAVEVSLIKCSPLPLRRHKLELF